LTADLVRFESVTSHPQNPYQRFQPKPRGPFKFARKIIARTVNGTTLNGTPRGTSLLPTKETQNQEQAS
jgi:hypothetical protein